MTRRLPALLGALVAAAAAACSPGPERPDVVLVIVDTLRADRLGCYGYPAARSAAIDRLARRGAQFRTAVSSTPVTAPSVGTILTGTYPQYHGVRDNGLFALGDSTATLAERFAGAGYRTAAFVSAVVLERRFGFDRGYDTYDDDASTPYTFFRPELKPEEAGHQNTERRGPETTDRAVEWIRTTAAEPFFLTLHLFDVHEPYDPPPPWNRGDSRALYDGEIATVDACVQRVVDALRETGRAERTVVALVADHGEGLGEHGESIHGFFIYDATVRVPWIVTAPGAAPQIVPGPGRLVDVAPTLLALGGVDGTFGQGETLAAEVRGRPRPGPPPPTYVETQRTLHSYGWAPLAGIRTGRWKLIRAPRPELYDLLRDPGELTNRYEAEPDTVARLSERLDELLARTSRADGTAEPVPVDDETRRRLEALGYVADAGGSDAADRGADPKDALPGFEARQRAKAFVIQGRTAREAGRADAAEAAFRRAIEIAPEYALGWYDLGQLQRATDRTAAAESSLAKATELDPDLGAAWAVRGLLAYARRDDALARECFETAWARTGEDRARQNLYELTLRTGRFDDALRFADRLRAVEPDDPWPARAHAFALARAGRFEEEAAFLKTELPAEDPTRRFRGAALRVFAAAPDAFHDLAAGRWSAAAEGLEAAIAAGADAAVLAPALGRALAESGKPERAERLLDGDPASDPLVDAHRLIALGRARLLQGDAATAMALFGRALQTTEGVFPPYRATVWWETARAAAAQGRPEAATLFTKALDDSYGRSWEEEAVRAGGRLIMRRER